MELSQSEKERIEAEEKVRFEFRKSLKAQEGGESCHAKGCGCGCHGGGSCQAKGCGCGCHGQASGYGMGAGCHGGPGHGIGCGCHRGGFWKGLILGVILALLFGFLCRHHGGWCHQDSYCPYSSSMTQPSGQADTPKK